MTHIVTNGNIENNIPNLPDLGVPPISVLNENNNDQQTNVDTSILTEKALFVSEDNLMRFEDTNNDNTIDEIVH